MEAARIAVLFACCLVLHESMPFALAQQKPEPPGKVAAPKLSPTLEPPLADERAMLQPPAAEPGEEVLPINLPAAMRLANARAWDIGLAVQQLRIASAQLQGARVLWLPNIVGGVDYVHHDGPYQNYVNGGSLSNTSFSSMYTGIAPLAIFALTDAIFAPLAQRQVTRAQDANVQTATNDTLTALAVTYFDAVEARADLAAIDDVVQRVVKVVRKTESMAPELVPDLEVARAQAALASAEEVRETARQRWRVAAAEVARVVRLKPSVLITPIESPELQITLVPPERTPDDLIPLAIRGRPEMTYNDALVQAARHRVRQERSRPFLPIFLVRGAGTQVPFPMAFGAFGGGTGGSLSNFNVRSDFDLEAIWQVNNLGFGNRALIRQRVEEHELARIEAFKVRDIVAKEVTQTWADLRSAYRRVGQAVRELQQARISADKNLEGLGETKRVAGAIRILVIRPLEAIVAQQALNQAYYDYFGAIADYNRAQFEMYRALGNPAQALGDDKKSMPPPLAAAPPNKPNVALEEAPPPRRVGQP
jgi:outer membrane protein TolC